MTAATGGSRTWLAILFASGALAAGGAYCCLTEQRALSNVRGELARMKEEIILANSQATTGDAVADQLQAAQDRVAQWRSKSPSDPSLVTLLGRLTSLADESGVTLRRLNPHVPVPLLTIRQHPLSLELEGDFAALMALLAQIEEQPEAIWIRSVHLHSPQQDGASVQCEIKLTVFADNREISG